MMPPPVGASGMLYRTVMALAGLGSVNSTYRPGVSRTAARPEASPGSVYAERSGPTIVPFVAACSASCSTKSTLAPRPVTSDGSRAARVTTGVVSACAVPVPTVAPMTRAATAVDRTALLDDIEITRFSG